MNLPTNTTADGTAFAVKSGERACFATMTNGGGTSPKRRLSWCINSSGGCAGTILAHYHKASASNIIGTTFSTQETAALVIWEV